MFDFVFMIQGRVTIKDIARELSISPSTVSRALKDHPDISQETKRKVKELAGKLNYIPDPIALSLKSRKSKIIGVIVPEIVHYFFSSVISGIEDIAYSSGYNVMFCQSAETYEREIQNVETLLSSRVEGILASVSKYTINFDHFRKVIESGIPLVFYDRVCIELETDRVVVDDYQGAFNATEHLINEGCRNIFLLSTTDYLEIGKERKKGFIDAMCKNGQKIREEQILKCDTIADARDIIPELFSLANPPDGIFAVNDLTAAETMIIAKEHGIKIPEDLAIVGFTNGQIAQLTDPRLSSVEQFGFNIGREAVKMLIKRLETVPNDYPVETKVIETKLIVKGSSRRAEG